MNSPPACSSADWTGRGWEPRSSPRLLLQSDEDITRVRDYCEHVFVDTRKSVYLSPKITRQYNTGERPRIPVEKIFEGHTIRPYTDAVEWGEEHPRAKAALDTLLYDISEVYEQASNSGKVDAVRIKKSADPVISSISRNPDACLWLGRLKRHDKYSYQHAISVSIWAVALGRQLGLQKHDLRSLAIGGMLMDVGKILVDPELLQADRALTEEETREMHHHVAHGVHLVKKSGIHNQDILDMVGFHHERYDGSGYPRGLKGNQIPPFARIAAIADTYDAMTSERSYADALAPAEAIRALYKERDVMFQAELVEAFIQAVGIYPAGTLVELTSGEVGVVVAESRTRRLLPKVILILDRRKQHYPRPKLVDLQDTGSNGHGGHVAIARSLEPGAYEIDISRYRI